MGDLEDSKSTSVGTLCILGSHTFVPVCWKCKKQTSVSHSLTESDFFFGTGLILDGIPALDMWNLIAFVLGSRTKTTERSGRSIIFDKGRRSQGKNQRAE